MLEGYVNFKPAAGEPVITVLNINLYGSAPVG
jgi:hypothetical protein